MISIYPYISTNPTNKLYYSTPNYQRSNSTRNQNSTNYSIRVTGKGEVSVKPNQVILTLGVVVEDMKVQNAQQQNAIISNKVIDALKNMGIQQDEIETSSYSIDPIYDYQDSQQIFRGYRVSHILRVTVKDLSSIGRIIDVAVENGANVVRSVSFEVSNPETYYADALQKATLNTKYNAESIAKSLGLTISSIPISIVEETAQIFRPQYAVPTTGAVLGVSTTPIQEGQVKITASVQALFNFVSF